jgi:hypothetical protein
MKDARKFWIIFISTVVVALLLHCTGCDPGAPGGKPVRRVLVSGVRIGSVSSCENDTGLWQNVPDGSFPDGGTTSNPQFKYWISPLDALGNQNQIGGMKVSCRVEPGIPWYDYPGETIAPPGINIKPTAVRTNASGCAIATVSANTACYYPFTYRYRFNIYASVPRSQEEWAGGIFAKNNACQYKCLSPSTDEIGEYWGSVQYGGQGRRTANAVGIGKSRDGLASISSTSSESTFLQSEPNIISPTLAVAVLKKEQCTARMTENGYALNPTEQFYVIDDADPCNIAENTTPYCISYGFQTAEPITLEGRTFTATLKIIDANSVVISSATIDIKITGDSGVRHVGRSGYFVLVEDPNLISSFTVATDGGHILVVPCREGDIVDIVIEDFAQFLPFVSDKWLKSCRWADKNNDGIVNMKDMQ